MMPSYEFENGQLREENNALRHERNAAQQRAEQAGRERDEARELLSRIRAITTAAPLPAPTVKADDGMTSLVRIDELTPAELLSAIGMRLKIANENLGDSLDEAGLRQMHNALVLMYHVLRGAK